MKVNVITAINHWKSRTTSRRPAWTTPTRLIARSISQELAAIGCTSPFAAAMASLTTTNVSCALHEKKRADKSTSPGWEDAMTTRNNKATMSKTEKPDLDFFHAKYP
ncbi:hypothetical protein RvY_04338-2 [Ramazzottius varieornatus]|uniref:Uncharacterized protein n=1 Tax=Ramazzottius varieornatus TaxID=947166 RepID=A0A1D1V1B9_RAMVA|nr:hypothetical protein RvY_04338-2 [Ramazzottius varieornatus]